MFQRGQKLFGVVISPTSPGGQHTNKVFVMHDSGIQHLFYVLREAFTLAPEAIVQPEGNEFDIVADIKNQVRRREKPLDVGDWVSWFYSGSDEISEFRREHKLHEMRAHNPHYQFLLDCVKSPTDICLWNQTFGYISITPEEARKLLPDIAFYAWVDIYMDSSSGKQKLALSFHSYEATNHKIQIKVLDTPWKEHHTVDTRGLTAEDEEEWLIQKVGEDKARLNNVYNQNGTYVAERSIYIPETPDKFYLLPYIDETLMVPGVTYRISAFWLDKIDSFIIWEAEKMVDMDVYHTQGDAREKILVLDSVNQRMDIKSLFHTKKENFGLMDDPTGALALHHLSRYAESKCRVYFYEDRHASFGRFRIEKVEVDKGKKIEKNVRDGVTDVKNVKGVVISSEGRIFSASHSPLRVFLPQGTTFPIGTHLIFTAKLNLEARELIAVEDTIKQLETPPLEYFEYNGRLFFQTETEWLPRADIVYGVVSEQFSLVEDPLRILPRCTSRNPAKLKVWVCESGTDKEGKRRVLQTPFFIASIKTGRPNFKTPKLVDDAGRDISGWIRLRDGTLQEMAEPKEVKSVAGKFTLPNRAPSSASNLAPSPSPSSLISRPSSSISRPSSSISRPTAPSPMPSSSCSTPVPPPLTHEKCGCAKGMCEAKKTIITLMNDARFRSMLPDDIMDTVLDCLL